MQLWEKLCREKTKTEGDEIPAGLSPIWGHTLPHAKARARARTGPPWLHGSKTHRGLATASPQKRDPVLPMKSPPLFYTKRAHVGHGCPSRHKARDGVGCCDPEKPDPCMAMQRAFSGPDRQQGMGIDQGR